MTASAEGIFWLILLFSLGASVIYGWLTGAPSARQEEYREYLQSEHWQRTRREALRIHGYQCGRCGARGRLDVHQLHYRSLWAEDPYSDLEVLCRDCHDAEHGR